MYTDKQLIKFGLYAERAHRLAVDAAFAAAELGQYSHGMAIVADETRNMGKKLYALLDMENINEAEIFDVVLQLKYLAINACLEMMRLHESQLTLKKRFSVIMDEIRNITVDIEKTFGVKQALPLVRPKILGMNTVITDAMIWDSGIRFVLFSIGDIPFCEAANNVQEVFYYPTKEIKDNTIQIRDVQLPVLNLYEKLSLKSEMEEYATVLVISTEYAEEPQKYALLVDDVPEVFYSGIGACTKPVGVPAEIVRECWACEEGLQMMFLDYSKIL